MGSRLARRVRILLFGALLQQESGWFDLEENNSGSLTSRLGADAQHVRGTVGDVLALMTQNICTCMAGLTIAFISGWNLTLVTLAVAPVVFASRLVQVKVEKRLHTVWATRDAAAADQVAAEAFRHTGIVQAFKLQDSIADLWRSLSETYFRNRRMSPDCLADGGYAQGLIFQS